MPTDTTWGRVTRAIGAAFDVQTGPHTLTSTVTGNLRKEAGRISSPVVVGDQVLVEALPDGTGLIRAVAPRRTEFRRVRARKPPQVLAANIDQALVAVAAAEPAPNFALVDRFLLAVRAAGLPVHLVVTKADLLVPNVRASFGIYEAAGFSVLYTSSIAGVGLDTVRGLVKDRVSLITGTSGVGKSSLLNALEPGLGLQIGAVSVATGKGKHTTRDFRLIPLAEGGWVADTPGMRDLYVWDVPREMVYLGFPELEPYLGFCRFANCTHGSEPGCAVARAAAEHAIHPWRLASFLDIYRSAPEPEAGRQRAGARGKHAATAAHHARGGRSDRACGRGGGVQRQANGGVRRYWFTGLRLRAREAGPSPRRARGRADYAPSGAHRWICTRPATCSSVIRCAETPISSRE